MKNITYLLVFLIGPLLISCDRNEGVLGKSNSVNANGLKNDYKIIKIEGCEYIMYDAGSGYSNAGFLAHKGNCVNHKNGCE